MEQVCKANRLKPRKKWQREDDDYLRQAVGKVSARRMAKVLNTSQQSIYQRMRMLGLKQIDYVDGLNAVECAEVTGINYSTFVQIWLRRGIKRKNVGRMTVIKEEDLVSFMLENTDLWDSSKLDKAFFNKYEWFHNTKNKKKQINWSRNDAVDIKFMRDKGMTWNQISEHYGVNKQNCKHTYYYYLCGGDYKKKMRSFKNDESTSGTKSAV